MKHCPTCARATTVLPLAAARPGESVQPGIFTIQPNEEGYEGTLWRYPEDHPGMMQIGSKMVPAARGQYDKDGRLLRELPVS